MKIKSSITKKVNDSLSDFRKTLESAIIEMLKDAGVNSCEDFKLNIPVVLSSKGKRTQYGATIYETKIADLVSYDEATIDGDAYLMLSYGDKVYESSWFMTIGDLVAVYEEVKRTIKSMEG